MVASLDNPTARLRAPGEFSYSAFVSYSRADLQIVDEVFLLMQKFRTPRRLMKEIGDHGPPPRSLNLFLDRKSAQLGTTVGGRLNSAIADSAFLIVFCSAASKRSDWVAQEIEAFLAVSIPERVLLVLMRTSPAQPIDELIPEPLLRLGDRMPLGADLLLDGGPQPVAHKLLGAMLGFAQDWVAREQERDDRRRRKLERAALASVAGLTSLAAITGWWAAGESKRAADSFEVSFVALDSTTPYMRKLLTEGRVRTSDVEGYSQDLKTIFDEVTDDELRNLPDVRLAFAQVLTRYAQLAEATGDGGTHLTNAQRAYRMMGGFLGEKGPQVHLEFCDAALEAANARATAGKFKAAIDAADRCVAAAEEESNYLIGDQDAINALAAKSATAVIARARIHLQQHAFAAALEDLDRVNAIETSLRPPRTPGSRPAESALVAETRGEILEAMGRFDEAETAFAAAFYAHTARGSNIYKTIGPISGLARQEGLVKGRAGRAIARLDPLISRVSSDALADPSHRALAATRAHLLLTRAVIEADGPRTPDTGSVSRAIADFEAAGEIFADLRRFDPENHDWRMRYVKRDLAYGEFLFRLGERTLAPDPRCRGNCMSRARVEIEHAISLLQSAREKGRDVLYHLCLAHLRLARTLRETGQPGAEDHLVKVRAYLDEFNAGEVEDRAGAVLEASLADEEADILLAAGRREPALEAYARAREIHDQLAKQEPNWVLMRRDALWTRVRIAEALATGDDRAATAAAYADACAAAAAAATTQSHLMQTTIAEIEKRAISAGLPCASYTRNP